MRRMRKLALPACAAGLLMALAGLLMPVQPVAAKSPAYRHYVQGKLDTPTPGPVSGGLLLLGGGDRDHEAMRWFFKKAGNGHIVILRASLAGQIGKEFYREIGGVQSAETFVFFNRSAAYDPKILARLRKADGIFVAGGDQARYVRYWKGTPVAAIINAHVAAGKPFAGTSAGLAIQGEKLYGAMDDGSITSAEALANPFGPANTIEGDFLDFPLLKGIVTDTHFKERDRLGRLFAFVAKAQALRPADAPAMIGLGVDESAALAVEPDGTGRIFATAPDGGAWLVRGEALRHVPRTGPLEVARVKVTGVGTASRVHLPEGRVEEPKFVRYYGVRSGRLAELPCACE